MPGLAICAVCRRGWSVVLFGGNGEETQRQTEEPPAETPDSRKGGTGEGGTLQKLRLIPTRKGGQQRERRKAFGDWDGTCLKVVQSPAHSCSSDLRMPPGLWSGEGLLWWKAHWARASQSCALSQSSHTMHHAFYTQALTEHIADVPSRQPTQVAASMPPNSLAAP